MSSTSPVSDVLGRVGLFVAPGLPATCPGGPRGMTALAAALR